MENGKDIIKSRASVGAEMYWNEDPRSMMGVRAELELVSENPDLATAVSPATAMYLGIEYKIPEGPQDPNNSIS